MKVSSLFPLASLLALALVTGALWLTWWERSQTPSAELLVEVLPEDILQVEPPDWDALARDIESTRAKTAPSREASDKSPPAQTEEGEAP